MYPRLRCYWQKKISKASVAIALAEGEISFPELTGPFAVGRTSAIVLSVLGDDHGNTQARGLARHLNLAVHATTAQA